MGVTWQGRGAVVDSAVAITHPPAPVNLRRVESWKAGEVAGSRTSFTPRLRATAFVAPALALIAVFLVFPAVWTLYLGITDYRLTGRSARAPEIVGLDNYTSALGDPRFGDALWLTLLFVFGSAIVGQTVLGFTLAWTLPGARGWVRGLTQSPG